MAFDPYEFGRGVRQVPSAIDEHARRLKAQAEQANRGVQEGQLGFWAGLTGQENPFAESVRTRGNGPLRVPTIEEAAEQWRPPGAEPAPWQTPRKTVPSIEEAAAQPPQPNDDFPYVWKSPEAKTAFDSANKQREEERRTIRMTRGADGVMSFTNQGGSGDVVMRNGESVGPDIGAPGRGFERFRDDKVFGQNIAPRTGGGSVSMMQSIDDPMKDPNYRNYLANAGRLDEAMAEQADISRSTALARNPFAQEEAAIDRAIRMQDAQTQSTYDRERLRQQAEQDSRAAVLSELTQAEQHAESERLKLRSSPQYMNAPMETKAKMEALIDNWLATQRAQLGVPNDAQWNRVG